MQVAKDSRGSTIKPEVRITSPVSGAVGGTVTIEAKAWDTGSRIKKVVFRVDSTTIGRDKNAPYSMEWDTSTVNPGNHTLKVIAIDNAGNRRTKKVVVSVEAEGPVTDPPPEGVSVEGEGEITAVGSGFVRVNGVDIYYNEATNLKLNDVSSPEVGMPAQYKGVLDSNGDVIATDLEIN